MAEKWELKDTLRSMTTKFNTAVEELASLQQDSTQSTQGIQDKLTEIQTELDSKLSEVTASDVGLGNCDNTADLDKPVSTAQQAAIDAAKTEVLAEASTHLTSEEAGTEIEDADDPEITPLIKQYIDTKIQEIGAYYATDNYGIAGTNNLGVVKASDDVKVDSSTGKMSIPALITLDELKEEQISSKERVDSIARVMSKIGDDDLETQSNTIIAAINELYNMITSLNS